MPSFNYYILLIGSFLARVWGLFLDLIDSLPLLGVGGAIFGVALFALVSRYLLMPLVAASINRTSSDQVSYLREAAYQRKHPKNKVGF